MIPMIISEVDGLELEVEPDKGDVASMIQIG